MARDLAVIGLDPEELRWVRMLVALLRHPDPNIPELARQAVLYISGSAADSALPPSKTRPRSR